MFIYILFPLQYFPDRFVRKDVLLLSVSCKSRHKGCDWEGKFGELIEHLRKCDYSLTQCKGCHKSLRYHEVESHKFECPQAGKKCPLTAIGCQSSTPMSTEELNEHLDFNKHEHMELMVNKMLKLESMVLSSVERSATRGAGKPSRREDMTESGFYSLTSNLEEVERDGPTDSFKKSAKPRLEVRDSSGIGMNGILDRKMASVFMEEVAKARSDLKTSVMKELKVKDEEISSLRGTITKLEKTVRSKTADFEDRDFRLSLIENSNYDGSMVWKIPQFSQRMSDAQSGKYTSIFSLPFYTGRYGYKMCLRLYILGDGIGKGGYMSLFFVLMKGEFDNILQWPFTHKVTFKLLNQAGGRDIVDTFQPDPMSTSFRKPRSDMNIASGCPRFVSHTDLKSGGYIVDDTVFIKCSIDTNTVKHP